MTNGEHGLAWNVKYCIGYPKVDEQHQKLFSLINELSFSIEEEADSAVLQETLDFLVNYAVEHFYEEEKLQVRYNYPGYREHKALHDDFKNTIGEHVTKYKEGGSISELSHSVNIIVARWVVNHILNEDKKIGVYIQAYLNGETAIT